MWSPTQCADVGTNLIGCCQELVVIRFGQFHSRKEIGDDPFEEGNIRSKELGREGAHDVTWKSHDT